MPDNMRLPKGKRCLDCASFADCSLARLTLANDTICAFTPSKFIQKQPAPQQAELLLEPGVRRG